jgi:WD40 repeat protein
MFYPTSFLERPVQVAKRFILAIVIAGIAVEMFAMEDGPCYSNRKEKPALRLAAQSALVDENHPQLCTLLAIEAVKEAPRTGFSRAISEQALINALMKVGGEPFENGQGAWDLAVSADSRLAVVGARDEVRVWDLTTRHPGTGCLVLRGHTDSVVDVAISDNHRWILSAGNWDNSARLWDMASSEPSKSAIVLKASAQVRRVAIGRDFIAAGSADGMVRLWKRAPQGITGSEIVLSGHGQNVHGDDITALHFSPDGAWLASASEDQTLRIWKLQQDDPGLNPIVFNQFQDVVSDVQFSPDGKWLISTCEDNKIRVWSMQQGGPSGEPRVLVGHMAGVKKLAISPNTHWLATASRDLTVRLWDLTSDSTSASHVLSGHTDSISHIAFSPDSKWLASCGADQTARLWDLTSLEALGPPHILMGPEATVQRVAFATNSQLLTASSDGVRQWDMRVPDPQTAYKIFPGVQPALSRDGRWLYIRSDTTRKGHLLDLDLNDPWTHAFEVDDTYDLSFEPEFTEDDHWLITPNTYSVLVWPVRDGELGPAKKLGGFSSHFQSFATSTNSKWIAASDKDSVHLWSLSQKGDELTPVDSVKLESLPGRVAVDPTGRRIAINIANKLLLWDRGNEERSKKPYPILEDTYTFRFRFTTDGRWLIADNKSALTLWDLTKDESASHPIVVGEEGADISSPEAIQHFAVRGGRWLVTGSNNANTLRIWDLNSREPAKTSIRLYGHTWPAFRLEIDPDDHWLMSYSNNEALLWDLTAKSVQSSHITVPMPPIDLVLPTLALARKRSALVVELNHEVPGNVRPDGVLLWKLNRSDLLAQAARRAGRKLSKEESRIYGVKH